MYYVTRKTSFCASAIVHSMEIHCNISKVENDFRGKFRIVVELGSNPTKAIAGAAA